MAKIKKESIKGIDDFSDAEIITIKREAVKQLLTDRNLREEKMKDRIAEYYKLFLANPKQNKYYVENGDGISVNFNVTKPEQPTNIVIPRELLKNYMRCCYLVNLEQSIFSGKGREYEKNSL